MIFKEVEYKDSDSMFDWEQVPDEDLWEDGELNSAQVQHKIIHRVMQTGDWIIIRELDNG